MGLDSVELLMEIENKFGITIPDAAAAEMRTVGDVYAYLLRQAGPAEAAPPCLSQRAFHEVRRSLMASGVERAAVRPAQVLALKVPLSERSKVWKRLSLDLSMDLPSLQIPRLVWTFVLAAPLGIFGWFAWTALMSGDADAMLSGLIGCAATFIIAALLALPFARSIPTSCQTVGELVRHVATNRERRARVFGNRDAAALWRDVATVISEFFGILPTEITPQLRLVEDLGLD